ncbi:nucleoporin Nup189 [Schizosaccharomyces cryophilus OY26]|uniref:Nucleoporin Nup189 n=1 Tax=Schizosaccharomyces cryophilus (strain OY26 / ATCC MYA-4695 / CBS 11777 / NBRC 106824 / NRRL Y48691) TaxID=653667 RepID=S9W4G0_SCHCR|nr:nucleoporin Nup189 [Schizosaccharomyces cryophilus OY26]EPY53404.1 nucleoporin Nup189 [Schizosaccharomyces cryophilus OY26]
MFGQNNSSGFGGGTGGFGQNNQQTGGLFGSNTNTTGNSLFGSQNNTTSGFGQNTAQPLFGSNSGGSLFGNRNPAPASTGTGFGMSSGTGTGTGTGLFGQSSTPAFGGTNTSGGGGLFGNTGAAAAPSTGSAFSFGSNNAGTTGGFGSAPANTAPTGGFFGSQNNPSASTGFGSQPSGGGLFGSASTGQAPAFGSSGFGAGSTNTINGTANPPYAVTSEKDAQTNGTSAFQSITCMPAYRQYSFEELRLQDYNQGRRYGNPANVTSTPSTFGSTPGFGTSTTGFGQAATPTSNSIAPFGSSNTNTNAGGGLFGGGSAFGANNTNTTSGFGANTANTGGGGGLFGQSNQPSTTPSTGLFGGGSTFGQQKPAFGFGSNTNTGGGGLFGSSTSNTATNTGTGTGGGLFGNTGGGFGANNTTTGFGSTAPSNPPASNTPGGGLFGFGNNSASGPNAPPSTGLGTGGGFSFGANNAASKPSGFGFGSTVGTGTGTGTTAPASSGFSFGQPSSTTPKPAFGASPAAPSTKPAGSGLFGGFGAGSAPSATTNNTTGTTGSTGGLFGNAGSTGGGLFGNTNTGTGGSGLFGNNTNNPPSTGGGLLGSSTNNTSAPGTSLFNKPSTGTGLFGSSNTFQQPSTGSSGLFGSANANNQTQPSTLGSGLFGGASQIGQQQQQQPLQASIDQNPYGSNPLFSSTVSQAPPTTIQEPIASPLTTKPAPKKAASLPQFWLSPRSSNRSNVASISPFAKSAVMNSASAPSKPKSLHLFDSLNDDVLLSKDAFTPRQNIKKLVITHKVSRGEVLRNENPSEPSEVPKANGIVKEETPKVDSDRTYTLPDGYWMKPGVEELAKYPKDKLSSVHQFCVGRAGYGQVSFLKPVDLTKFEKVEDIPVNVVLFEKKICSVYPEEGSSPQIGEGLNVPAIITLENAWPLSRETREPIKDVNHPRYAQHLKRLQRIKETEFIDFNEGKWTFKVQHFSKYGLFDDDSENDENLEDEPVSSEVPMKSDSGNSEMYEKSDHQGSQSNKTQLTHNTPGSFPPTNNQSNALRKFNDQSENFDELSIKKAKLRTDESGRLSQTSSKENEIKNEFEPNDLLLNMTDDPNDSNDLKSQDNMDDEPDEVVGSDIQNSMVTVSNLINPDTWLEHLNLGLQRSVLIKSKMANTSSVQDNKEQAGSFAYDQYDLEKDLFGSSLPTKLVSSDSDDSSIKFLPKFHFYPNGSYVQIINGKLKLDALEKVFRLSISANEDFIKPLEYQLSESEIYVDANDICSVSPRLSMAIGDLAAFTKSSDEIKIWELASILFGMKDFEVPTPLSPEARELLSEKFIRDRVSEWITKHVKEEILAKAQKAASSEEKIFILLTGNQISLACEEAVNSENNRLSTLIPLVDSDFDIQAEVKQQLDQWRERGDLAYINKYTRLIFELLSGNTDLAEGYGRPGEEGYVPSMFVSQGLSWLSAFGLKLWYNVDISITEAMSMYMNSLKMYEKDLQRPIVCGGSNGEVYDLLFLLLKAYAIGAVLEELTLPESAKSNGLDYRVVWQLAIYLSKARAVFDFSDRDGLDEVLDENGVHFKPQSVRADTLTPSFASQLECMGHWQWSIFVLLHVENVETRISSIKECLGRNVKSGLADKDEKLMTKLLIPRNWIHEAMALNARYNGEHAKEVTYLQEANLFEEAHKCLIRSIAPQAIISNNFEELRCLLGGFQERMEGIIGWKFGGQLYSDYLDLVEGKFETDVETLKFILQRITVALKEAESQTIYQKASLHKMIRFVNKLCINQSLDDVAFSLPLTTANSLQNLQYISVQY